MSFAWRRSNALKHVDFRCYNCDQGNHNDLDHVSLVKGRYGNIVNGFIAGGMEVNMTIFGEDGTAQVTRLPVADLEISRTMNVRLARDQTDDRASRDAELRWE